MKPTVSQQTAKQLAEAGFLPPFLVEVGQVYFNQHGQEWVVGYRNLDNKSIVFRSINDGRWEWPEDTNRFLFAPTATDIIKQMPIGTHLVYGKNHWTCWFKVTMMEEDFRHDECPHECAAKAFLAWKAGLE